MTPAIGHPGGPSGRLRHRGRAACAVALLVAACGGDGAGTTGTTGGTGATQTPPAGGGGTSGALSVVVSGAVPTSGNALLSGASGTATPVAGTLRRLVADGTGNGFQHRITVDFDGVTGVVLSVTHGWGASLSALDAATQCVRVATAAGQAVCGDAVTVDVAARRASFAGVVLRGAGSFASILTGQVAFTVP